MGSIISEIGLSQSIPTLSKTNSKLLMIRRPNTENHQPHPTAMFPNSSEILTESLLLAVLLKSWEPLYTVLPNVEIEIIHVFCLYIYNKPRHTQTIFIFSLDLDHNWQAFVYSPVSIRRVKRQDWYICCAQTFLPSNESKFRLLF